MDLHEAEEVICIRDAACGLVALWNKDRCIECFLHCRSYDHAGLLVIYSEPDERGDRKSEYSHEVHIWECGEKVMSMRWHEERVANTWSTSMTQALGLIH